ncbi:MAG: hypothetical protein JW913_03665 [Chitinispirillaceae bacterium]|nr:hypothetical protein [Chitinispirillaceae bacterium]
MFSRLFQVILTVSLFYGSTVWALSGTGGTPLGGMGTGYVVFDGSKICVSSKLPPAAVDHSGGKTQGQPEKQLSSSGFYLFANGTAKTQVKAASEEAKCPLQTADFGAVGNVKFALDAFGPYWPGEGKLKYQLATSPLALFDVTAVNSGAEAADVAVALEVAHGGALGGASSGKVETGNKAISFSGSENSYLAVDCDGTTPTFSAGGKGTFETDGKLANADGNLVAAKCNIPAGGTAHFKFVLAWYRTYDSEGYYYQNFYQNSKEAAEAGLSNFDGIRNGITSFVDRVMASNFPEWYKDRLLNNTYPLIHNSVCAKDGRVAFWEGNYGIIGTVDQGQHAAVFYTFNWPAVQWHELQYWARQQKSTGQVHHDFNEGKEKFNAGSSANNRHLLAWDNKTHADYWWFPNTDTWADLNCMFIFKAHELMMATGDLDSLKKNWPALKKSADRLASQCGGGSSVPSDAHSTYDRCQSAGTGCSLTPEYNGGIAIAAFNAIAEIAKFCGEDASATTFAGHSKSLKAAFKQKYGSSSDFGVKASAANSGRFPESHVAGYAWANYLCLDPVMDEGFITNTCQKLRSTQKSGGVRANGEWIFYCVDHYGGAEIAINKPDEGLAIHKLDYDYYYKQVPKMVFWQSLQEGDGNTHKDSYMTAPTVWHSYFQFCGYMIDNANKRLWIRPRIPTSMNKKITDALLLNPKCLGTLNYEESATGQCIRVSYDAPGATVSEIVLKNNSGSATAPPVTINDEAVTTVTAEGSDLEKNLRIKLASPITIGPEGIRISVNGMDCKTGACSKAAGSSSVFPLSMNSYRISAGMPVHYSTDAVGVVTMELLSLNGARIGTIMQEQATVGAHTFVWDGKTLNGKRVGSVFAILRLTSPGGSMTKAVFTGR